jgi:hypothetical protein
MNALLPILILTVVVLALDLAAIRFGADSRDRFGGTNRDLLR